MATYDDELRALTADAVRKAQVELFEQFGSDALFSFALCTDDDVRTLYHVACTKEWVEMNKQNYPEIGYIYVEWEQSADGALFDNIGEKLATLADQDYPSDEEWVAARDRRFELLVQALHDCRNEGIFTENTLLCVGSTDPSNELECLAMNAVDRLNPNRLADQFAEALGYEAYRHTS